MSGYTQLTQGQRYQLEVDIKKAKRAGFNKYLTKPIDVDQFLDTIDEILG